MVAKKFVYRNGIRTEVSLQRSQKSLDYLNRTKERIKEKGTPFIFELEKAGGGKTTRIMIPGKGEFIAGRDPHVGDFVVKNVRTGAVSRFKVSDLPVPSSVLFNGASREHFKINTHSNPSITEIGQFTSKNEISLSKKEPSRDIPFGPNWNIRKKIPGQIRRRIEMDLQEATGLPYPNMIINDRDLLQRYHEQKEEQAAWLKKSGVDSGIVNSMQLGAMLKIRRAKNKIENDWGDHRL